MLARWRPVDRGVHRRLEPRGAERARGGPARELLLPRRRRQQLPGRGAHLARSRPALAPRAARRHREPRDYAA